MAKTINVTWNGQSAVFNFKSLDRAALYGKRRRIAFDEAGEACLRASLLNDGSMVLKSGMTGQGYFLPDGRWVAQGDLEGINRDGSPAELVPSTIGVDVALEGPVPIEEVLEMKVATVYMLDAASPSISVLTTGPRRESCWPIPTARGRSSASPSPTSGRSSDVRLMSSRPWPMTKTLMISTSRCSRGTRCCACT